MRWAYLGIVRPCLTYASVIWGHELGTLRIKNALKRLDRLAMLTLAVIKPSTPTEGLSVIYDIIPNQLAIKQLGLSSYIRQIDLLQHNWKGKSKNKTFNISHLHYWDQSLQEADIRLSETDALKEKIWEKDFLAL